jgi:hypothetical protein
VAVATRLFMVLAEILGAGLVLLAEHRRAPAREDPA